MQNPWTQRAESTLKAGICGLLANGCERCSRFVYGILKVLGSRGASFVETDSHACVVSTLGLQEAARSHCILGLGNHYIWSLVLGEGAYVS
jgi:hypothetical protein